MNLQELLKTRVPPAMAYKYSGGQWSRLNTDNEQQEGILKKGQARMVVV